MSSTGFGVGATSMAASPIVLTRRTGDSVASSTERSNLRTSSPRSSGGISSPRRVKPTMSTNPIATRWAPGRCPLRSSASPTAALRSTSRMRRFSMWLSVGAASGTRLRNVSA